MSTSPLHQVPCRHRLILSVFAADTAALTLPPRSDSRITARAPCCTSAHSPHPPHSLTPLTPSPLSGKMEKSFVAYALRYPQAPPLPDMDGAQFNLDVISPRAHQGPSPRFDGLERHGDFAELLTAASASAGVEGQSMNEYGGGGVQDGLELAGLGRSDSEGRCDGCVGVLHRARVTSRAVPVDCPSDATALACSAPKTRVKGQQTSSEQSAGCQPCARAS